MRPGRMLERRAIQRIPPEREGASTTGRTGILIVDDDPGIREMVTVALSADGYRVAGCGNGRDALNHLRSHADIGVILLDLLLPVMDATAFRAAQLRDRSLSWIPVIVMSGAVNAAPDAGRMGASAFIRKPIDINYLRDTLHQLGRLGTRLPPNNPRV
jgi:DNA-binding NtrC family response regulator